MILARTEGHPCAAAHVLAAAAASNRLRGERAFDIPNEILYIAREERSARWGVEGKDKAKVLEAGAASLSNQLGQAVLKLRKGYGLSLADLSQHSGVAKSIISQIERVTRRIRRSRRFGV